MMTVTIEMTSQEAARVALAISRDISNREWMAKHHGQYQNNAIALLQGVRERLGEYQSLLLDEYFAWADGEISQISDEAAVAGKAQLEMTKQILRDARDKVFAELKEQQS